MASKEQEAQGGFLSEEQVPSPVQYSMEDQEKGNVKPLKRVLQGRHMQMIAIVSPFPLHFLPGHLPCILRTTLNVQVDWNCSRDVRLDSTEKQSNRR